MAQREGEQDPVSKTRISTAKTNRLSFDQVYQPRIQLKRTSIKDLRDARITNGIHQQM